MFMIELDLDPSTSVGDFCKAVMDSKGSIVEFRTQNWGRIQPMVVLFFNTEKDAIQFLKWYDWEEYEFFLKQLHPIT